MITKTYGGALIGVEACLISIEVSIINGTQCFVVGLPDNAVKESLHRIESALKQAGWRMPRRKVIINLAPASLRKEGASYDLPIALSILHASKQVSMPQLKSHVIMGELALDGQLRKVSGALPIALKAKEQGVDAIILPQENACQAALVPGIKVFPAKDMKEVVAHFIGDKVIKPLQIDLKKIYQERSHASEKLETDYTEIKGQTLAKRAFEIAAAGGHNILLVGPPGAGKTMLAKRLPTILPALNFAQAIETSALYSITKKLPPTASSGLIVKPPFRAPHHTISDTALVGGGPIPRPGEVSFAHNGVLFLDELLEFKRSVLEVMRQPLEEGQITVSRAKATCVFPARFLLVASLNPCPCGYYTHPQKPCHCLARARKKYKEKLSGPLIDRIDLHLMVTPLNQQTLYNNNTDSYYTSEAMRKRVVQARKRQTQRFKKTPWVVTNADMSIEQMERWCRLSNEQIALLQRLTNQAMISARGYSRIRKIARTIADLDHKEQIGNAHIAEALHLNQLNW